MPENEQNSAELAQVPNAGQLATPMDDLFAQDAGGGMEGIGANDMALPFITILQKGSPQVSRANAKYIKDAQAGMIMNTVNGSIFSGETGIQFIPCGFQKKLVHWTSRDSGGGFLGHIQPDDPILAKAKTNEKGQLELPDKSIIVDTAYHFGLFLHDDGFPEFSIVSMYSTGLKVSRNWNTLMKGVMKKDPKTGRVFNPPTFSHIYRLTTAGMQKDNYDWFQWRVTSEGEVTDPQIYMMAREFSKAVAAGSVRISKPTEDFGGSAGSGDDTPF